MVWHNDEPLDFANSVHIFALSRLAKQHVTVVLTGEGSDELFAGYPRYRIPELARATRGGCRRPLRRLAARAHRRSSAREARSLCGDAPTTTRCSSTRATCRPEVVARSGAAPAAVCVDYRRECLAASARLGLDPVGRVSLLDQETFLVGILHRQDKMSMAASIESRVPFMDYRIVEFANRLPRRSRWRGGRARRSSRTSRARCCRPRSSTGGSRASACRWRAGSARDDGLGARLRALPDARRADVFDRTALAALIAEHRGGTHDHSELLWTALNLATWRETFRVLSAAGRRGGLNVAAALRDQGGGRARAVLRRRPPPVRARRAPPEGRGADVPPRAHAGAERARTASQPGYWSSSDETFARQIEC